VAADRPAKDGAVKANNAATSAGSGWLAAKTGGG